MVLTALNLDFDHPPPPAYLPGLVSAKIPKVRFIIQCQEIFVRDSIGSLVYLLVFPACRNTVEFQLFLLFLESNSQPYIWLYVLTQLKPTGSFHAQ